LPFTSSEGSSVPHVISIDATDVVFASANGTLVANRVGAARVQYTIGAVDISARVFVSASGASVNPKLLAATVASSAEIQFSQAVTLLDSGAVAQFTATYRPARASRIVATPITWSASPSNVGVISATGILTALRPGTVTVTASSSGISRVVRVLVRSVAPASVVLTPASAVIDVGATQAYSLFARSVSGNLSPISGCVLRVSDPSKAVINGLSITGTAAGALFVIASCGTVSDTATVSIRSTATPPPGSPACVNPALPEAPSVTGITMTGAAQLPAAFPTFCVPAPTRSISVAPGGNLQAALDAAQPGDQLLLSPGATYTGNFWLRAKAGTGWITIRTAPNAGLPAAGARILPSASGSLAKIVSNSYNPALSTEASAARYYVTNLEFSVSPSVTEAGRILDMGDGSSAQTSLSQMPSSLLLDQLYVHGSASLQLRRCIGLNGGSTAIINSTIVDCNNTGFDAQAIMGWNGSGPYWIENNTLQAATEVVVFGGGYAFTPNVIPADITIRHNHISRPDAHLGLYLEKNLIEFKSGKRVLVEENVFERVWASAQSGFAVVVTPDNSNAWNSVSDLTFRSNIFRKIGNWVLTGVWSNTPAQRLSFINNIVTEVNTGIYTGSGHAFVATDGNPNLEFIGNTFVGGPYIFQANGQYPGLKIQDNVLIGDGSAEAWFTSYGVGSNALNQFATGYTFTGNAMVGMWWGLGGPAYPAGNPVATRATTADFASPGTDWTLTSSSVFKGRSSTGGTPGATTTSLSQLPGLFIK
jgi:hypothetical protein